MAPVPASPDRSLASFFFYASFASCACNTFPEITATQGNQTTTDKKEHEGMIDEKTCRIVLLTCLQPRASKSPFKDFPLCPFVPFVVIRSCRADGFSFSERSFQIVTAVTSECCGHLSRLQVGLLRFLV
jgi:hypothetical protein